MKPKFAAAAFAPFGHRDSEALESAASRAISWIQQRETAEGVQASVLTPQRDDYDALAGFDKVRPTATPRSTRNLRHGPVLIFAADMEMVELASSAAVGFSIVVVDWGLRWLPGWASVTDARNLRTGIKQPRFAPEIRHLLDALDWAGNNGWSDGPGKRDAKRLLAEIDLPTGEIQGAMLAYGHSARSVKDLARLATL